MNALVIPEAVLRFLAENIDTVPHLEALLLLWQDAKVSWSADEIASRIYVKPATAQQILQALHRRKLVTAEPSGRYRYCSDWDTTADLMAEVAAQYSRHLVPLTTFIHSGASTSVREFARAFDFKKER